MESTAKGSLGMSYGWAVVAILWVSHMVYFLNYMTVGTLAPFIKSEFDISSAKIGFLASATTLGSTLIQIPAGLMSDRRGTKWIMAAGLLLMGVSAIGVFFIHSYTVLFLLLLFIGLGIGCNQTPATKAIVMWFALRGRATAMGIKQSGVTMGGIVASFCLPRIAIEAKSWKYGFLASGLVALVATAIILLFYEEAPGHPEGSSEDWLEWRTGAIRLFFDRDFMLLCLTGILLMLVQYAFAAHFVMFASSALGLTVSGAGAVLGISFVTAVLGRILWSMVSDYLFKARRKMVVTLIGAVGAAVCAGFALLIAYRSTAWLYLLAVVFGLTGLGWNAIYLTRVGEFPGKALAGIATGLNFAVINAGAVSGPPLYGYLVDMSHGYTVPWIVVGFCMLLVAFLSKIQKRERLVGE